MDYSVAVGGGGDPAGFGFVDFKGAIGSGLISLGLEFGLNL